MGWHEMAAVVGGLLSVVAVGPYIRDMLKGTTRPNIVTWGLWTLILVTVTVAQFSAGASWSLVLPFVEAVTVGAVFILALGGYGYKKYGLLDAACLLCALLAIVLWQLTQEPLVALVFAVLADLIASIPTLAKSYKDPGSETASAYLIIIIAAVFSGLATAILDVANLIWPVYIFLINGSILSLILLGKRAQKSWG